MKAPGEKETRYDWRCAVCGTLRPWYEDSHCEDEEEEPEDSKGVA